LQYITDKIYKTRIFDAIGSSGGNDLFFDGISGSLKSFIISYIFTYKYNNIIYCAAESSKLFELKDDLNFILEKDCPEGTVSLYLDKYDEEYESEISPLSSVLKKITRNENYIVLLEPSVFVKDIISEDTFKQKIILLKKNSEYDFEELITKLNSLNFKRKHIVEEENDFAVRGGIIDVFPENHNQPLRIEFFGNTIESIRYFDLVTQRSVSQLNDAEILPSLEEFGNEPAGTEKFLDYISEDTLILIDEPDIIKDEYEKIFEKLGKFPASYFSVFSLLKALSIAGKNEIREISFNSAPQPPFHSNIKLLFENLKDLHSRDYEIFITSTDDYQTKRFKELIDDIDDKEELTGIKYLDNSVHEGFILPDDKITLYSEHQVFERFFRPAKRKKKFAGLSFKELSKVNYGDFMVHQNYGIGKYAGLKKISVGGVNQEAVKLLYLDNDIVFVNLNSLHLLKKYSAQEGHIPKLNKVGGYEWEKIKQRTKKKIQDIARDLILLYSKRKSVKGFRFSPDNVWQKELEASFIYEDTPDQVSATEAVKEDMMTDAPMDRLICGDVGFGKTEVGVRAAFKCVLDNKQAAVLVPTTILAEQHYNTLKDRLTSWAVEVQHLSRFKTKKEQKEILDELSAGKINIIIGTHRLLSKDVKFKDLGLLIIDEEQRFGVKAKEKLKFMRENVDVLTLTATPIPRTLNFSLLGARDLSIINTPPKNRQPIHTEIINFDKKVIANAIIRELSRGGQVYFVNDRIAKLEQLAEMIEELVPYAKVAVAYGQMTSSQLEKVMMRFLEKKINVLVCTKIIESGLDIPSVNTIIINRADNFGLAELYQLRGRVGRSNIKSFAYLITPPHSSLTKTAIRRLHALEEFTELGSGLNLALRDLEIRGAGNLLGREQSGFIAEIGFDMYMQLLDEAVTELKGSELGIALAEFIPQTPQPKKKEKEVIIESDISILIPEWYIDEENTRLDIYQRLSGVRSIDELNGIRDEMVDRFGKLPDEVLALLKHVELKLLAQIFVFEKINIKGNSVELYFDLSENNAAITNGWLGKIVNYLSEEKDTGMKLVQTKSALALHYHLMHAGNSIEKLSEVGRFIEKLKNL
jgi:transcription-repair coupling factor (superfamily II helicase)